MNAARIAAVLCAATPLSTAPVGIAAQEPVVVREDSPPCVIELMPGPGFSGGLSDENWVSDATDMEILSDGRLALTERLWPYRFLVASPEVRGGRWVGHRGEGPGEYRFIRMVRARGDRLHVFDLGNVRRTVLDAVDFKVIHTNSLQPMTEFGFDAVVLDDSSYVINGSIRTADRAGYALHLFDDQGGVVRSFDEVPVGLPGGASGFRWLTAARGGGVWSVSLEEYRIDLWDVAEGKRMRSLVREAEWFPPRSGVYSLHPDRPAPPRIGGLMEDSERRLWVLVAVAAPERWADCFVKTPPDSHPEAGEYTLRENCSLSDYRIDVLDSEEGRILATGSVPQGSAGVHAGWRVAGEGLFSVEKDAFGFPIVRLWNPVLRSANNTQRGDEPCAA